MSFRKVQPFLACPVGVVAGDKTTFLDENDRTVTQFFDSYENIIDNGQGDLKRLLKSGANIQEVSTNLFGDGGLSTRVNDFGNDNDDEG